MKIYTRYGDNGTAGLFSGERILKSHERIEAIGDLDELNATLGMLRSYLPETVDMAGSDLQAIQSDLFYIGARLATSRESPTLEKIRVFGDDRIEFLEAAIDRMDLQLPPLQRFVLPNGNRAASWAHFARTVCRRAERRTVRLSIEASLGNPPRYLANILKYLNRLSDYLFVLARLLNTTAERREQFWEQSAG